MNKAKVTKQDPLSVAIGALKAQNSAFSEYSQYGEVVDIITFCDSPLYLDLLNPKNKLNLYVSQRIILKCFYMGDVGNENLKLTKEEWEWLYAKEEHEVLDGETYENNIKDVIKKMLSRERDKSFGKFSTLQLVLGRRAGKTVMASIITVYEAYKLLTINGGNAHEYYNCPAGDEIAIINVALSQEQAGILFGQIAARLRDSPFFQNRVASQSASEIRLFTNTDLERLKKKSAIKTLGSIVLMCGHSNPDSLAGRSAILILFDEIAFYDESGKVTGTYFYSRLKPSLSKFYERGDGKVVMISSPNKQNGIFWDIFEKSKNEPSTLSFQLPTWSVNDDVSYDLEETQKDRRANIERFMIEYGAQWATGGDFGNLFPAELIDRCVRHDIQRHTRPSNKFNYYLHIDPANGGNNYVAVLVAKERYVNHFGKKRTRCHLANLWIWRPVPKVGLQFHLIDKEVVYICSIFRPNLVTYDAYNSKQSMELLRSHGINTKFVPFNRSMKQKMYQNLNDLMVYEPTPELCLYSDGGDADLLISELKGLRKKRTQRGFGIIPDKHGEVNTDDLADALAGACAMACDGLQMSLPLPVTVLTGIR